MTIDFNFLWTRSPDSTMGNALRLQLNLWCNLKLLLITFSRILVPLLVQLPIILVRVQPSNSVKIEVRAGVPWSRRGCTRGPGCRRRADCVQGPTTTRVRSSVTAGEPRCWRSRRCTGTTTSARGRREWFCRKAWSAPGMNLWHTRRTVQTFVDYILLLF